MFFGQEATVVDGEFGRCTGNREIQLYTESNDRTILEGPIRPPYSQFCTNPAFLQVCTKISREIQKKKKTHVISKNGLNGVSFTHFRSCLFN